MIGVIWSRLLRLDFDLTAREKQQVCQNRLRKRAAYAVLHWPPAYAGGSDSLRNSFQETPEFRQRHSHAALGTFDLRGSVR